MRGRATIAHGVPVPAQTRGRRPCGSVSAIPNWQPGEVVSLGQGERLRILAIDTDISDELVEGGINAVFTVEPTEARNWQNRRPFSFRGVAHVT
jgi:hypothetical protein